MKRVEIGVIGRPHGVRGAFRVFLHNPNSDLLFRIDNVFVTARDGGELGERALAEARPAGKHCIAALEGVESREGAEALTGGRLSVARDVLPDLKDDELYVLDLIGLEVWQGEVRLGAVVGSREQGGIEMLAVVEGETEVEIPLVDAFVVDVKLSERRIEVRETDDLPRSKRARARADRV